MTDFFHVAYQDPKEEFPREYNARFTDREAAERFAERERQDGCEAILTALNPTIRESRAVPVKEWTDYKAGDTWTVYIEELPWPMRGFLVWAIHDLNNGTGTTGFYEVGQFKSLGHARDRAGGYVTVACRGGPEDYDWRASEWRRRAS